MNVDVSAQTNKTYRLLTIKKRPPHFRIAREDSEVRMSMGTIRSK